MEINQITILKAEILVSHSDLLLSKNGILKWGLRGICDYMVHNIN